MISRFVSGVRDGRARCVWDGHFPRVSALRYQFRGVSQLGLFAFRDEVLGDGLHRVVVHL
jgi:hypothetical protein